MREKKKKKEEEQNRNFHVRFSWLWEELMQFLEYILHWNGWGFSSRRILHHFAVCIMEMLPYHAVLNLPNPYLRITTILLDSFTAKKVAQLTQEMTISKSPLTFQQYWTTIVNANFDFTELKKLISVTIWTQRAWPHPKQNTLPTLKTLRFQFTNVKN